MAQTDLPPEKGGTTYELGMPPVWKGSAGAVMGWYRPSTTNDLTILAQFGVRKDLMSPVIGLAAIGFEGYFGNQSRDVTGGGRALFSIPALHFSVGADYDVNNDELDVLLRLELAMRRSGIFGRGSMVQLNWLPGRGNTFTVGVDVPLWGRNIGKTRPRRDAVKLEDRPLHRIDSSLVDVSLLQESLALVEDGATWIARVSMPFADEGGKDPREVYAESLAELTAHLNETSPRFPNGRNLNEEIRVFHEELDRLFSIAVTGRAIAPGASTMEGRAASDAARRIFLDEIAFPYNRLLGQRKAPNTLDQFVAVGMSAFTRWVTTESGIPEGRWRVVGYAYQSLVDITRRNWEKQQERWEDSRFNWIPLQLGLRADEHDTQDELDHIIERAVGAPFQKGNRIWYVMNEDFQLEMARSVLRAEDYHVLWIHDYRGKNGQGDPDEVAFEHTLNYLRAMTMRVRDYEKTGKLPIYMLFLDQHYFELNKGRVFLRVLHDPLDYELSLPRGYEAWEQRLVRVQDSLRQAIDESLVLQGEGSQYGRKWLRNQIKVHINITNPSDWSFTSNHIAGILPVPDNMMRDHRKIAFYDLTEEDPYKGMAMFTGMGIGEHYAGRNWEDRAVMIQGPGALPLKDAARELLEVQGFEPRDMPYPLRALPKPQDYDIRVQAFRDSLRREWAAEPGEVLQLHNKTGFNDKPINVAKAVLYSLMPAGSYLKVPDSLWQNYVYASLLAGSALRGCKVLIYAPTLESAPARAGGSMARAHGLLGALINFANVMQPELDAQGGVLRIGMYSPEYGVGDLRGRITQARAGHQRWLADLGPSNPAVTAVLDSLDIILESVGYTGQYLIAEDTTETPKLHMKANFMIEGQTWMDLMAVPEWGPIMREYIKYLASMTGPPERRPTVKQAPAALIEVVKDLVARVNVEFTPEQQARGIAYLTVGSVNMDYRSMVMDGEAMVITTGWGTLGGLIDFIILVGLCEWIDDLERLDELLPPPSGFGRWNANLLRLAL
jgi:hypothetical protein